MYHPQKWVLHLHSTCITMLISLSTYQKQKTDKVPLLKCALSSAEPHVRQNVSLLEEYSQVQCHLQWLWGITPVVLLPEVLMLLYWVDHNMIMKYFLLGYFLFPACIANMNSCLRSEIWPALVREQFVLGVQVHVEKGTNMIVQVIEASTVSLVQVMKILWIAQLS